MPTSKYPRYETMRQETKVIIGKNFRGARHFLLYDHRFFSFLLLLELAYWALNVNLQFFAWIIRNYVVGKWKNVIIIHIYIDILYDPPDMSVRIIFWARIGAKKIPKFENVQPKDSKPCVAKFRVFGEFKRYTNLETF